MITDAHLNRNSVILSKFDGKFSKVDQVTCFSVPIGIPNMKALELKYFLRYLAHKIIKFCFQRDFTQ